MPEYLLQREQYIPAPIDQVFSFFADAGNLDFLTPPWLHFKIKTPLPIVMKSGTLIEYTIRWRLLPVAWRTEILDWSPPYKFIDQQIKGPYTIWHHTHTFESQGEGTLMKDIVRYALPLGPVGMVAHGLIVKEDLHAIFDYRFQRIAERFGTVKWSMPLTRLEGDRHAIRQNV